MREKHLINLLMDGNIVVPLDFYRRYKALNISLEEFIFLMYLRGKGNLFLFDPSQIALELGYDTIKVLELISSLSDKKLLLISTVKMIKELLKKRLI